MLKCTNTKAAYLNKKNLHKRKTKHVNKNATVNGDHAKIKLLKRENYRMELKSAICYSMNRNSLPPFKCMLHQ